MKKLYFLLFTFLITSLSFGQASDLYFSMYGEGSSSNKFLEIYNGTTSDLDLGDYSVELYGNGSASATETLTFTGGTMLTKGDVYVIYNASASPSVTANGDTTSNVTFLNGDDAVALLKMGVVIDVIGEIGNDPGSSWTVGASGSTANNTLIRKSSVCSPNATALSSFGTDDNDSEWLIFGSDQEWGQIGAHFGCSSDPFLAITDPIENSSFSSSTTNVNLSINVQNFDVANGTGDGHIYWTINGTPQSSKYDDSDESVAVIADQGYAIYMELRDNSNTAIIPNVNRTINFSIAAPPTNALVITGVFDAKEGSAPKGVELYALKDVSDLSSFGIGGANNGGGTDGEEFTFPAVTASKGDFIYVSQEAPVFTTFFGQAPDYTNSAVNINGDDAIELFENGEVIDTFGTIDCDPNATSSPCPEWEHTDGWAYRVSNTGPDGATFVLGNWTFSGVGNLDGIPANSDSTSPFPFAQYLNTLSTNNFIENLIKLYPNPTSLGYVNISSRSQTAMKVNVFDILGKQVINTTISNKKLNVSSLNAGVYIMKVSQDNATTTKKLVIQ